MTRFGHSSGRSFSFLFLSDFESQEQQQQLIGSAIKRRRRRFQSSSFLLKVKPVASLRIRGEREREKKEPSLVA
jgi:CRISPR/Cas system-associated endoribonuclease Cas2